MNELVIYTVITGDYDNLKEIPSNLYFPEKIDYICLTDSNIVSNTYKIINIKLINNDCIITQKYFKIIIHEYIKKYKKSIYIDGKVTINNNIYN